MHGTSESIVSTCIASSENLPLDGTSFDDISGTNTSKLHEKRGDNIRVLKLSVRFNLPSQQQQANIVTPSSHNLPHNNNTCMINTHLSHQTGKPSELDG